MGIHNQHKPSLAKPDTPVDDAATEGTPGRVILPCLVLHLTGYQLHRERFEANFNLALAAEGSLSSERNFSL